MRPECVPDDIVMPLVWAGADEAETRDRLAAAITERERSVREQAESATQTPNPPCEACGRPVMGRVRRGWCPACYYRWHRAGQPETGPPSKRQRITACTSCGSTDGRFIRSWCPRCYNRWIAAGQPEAGPPAVKVREPKVDEPTVARLRGMYATAKTVNGGMPADDPARTVSIEFTAELQALVEQGVTPYELAKTLGTSQRTIYARLARHGYRTSPPSQAKAVYKGHKIGGRP